ncbi:LysM peptidoglycan-binding domain-containing protein [Burkholderia sp. BKH01]|uniref:LysM peptidoglycan-binding domain-containing protein n=1 Tax=Burkholderia sp. BKH01 TaxID=2769262 RepID=UPI0021E0857B|nr:LysM peptidoglycan-binding domain-containing protein [Burkholderia sp. BKH01]MCU9952106.1 LysM peptidoglycan-binding domain-containing protein [Burkholderia sp. BKH01]
MKEFLDLLAKLMKGAPASESAAEAGIVGFGKLLYEQSEIRFYVDGTPNFGHQASTIYVLKRLIDHFGYKGAVRIVYQNAPAGKQSTPAKLALLLTGLVPADIATATIAYGTCQDIRFVAWDHRAALNNAVLGFTGGADNVGENLATELKVQFFLRLQPFMWKKVGGEFVANTIEFGDVHRESIDLAASTSTVFPLLPFRYLAAPTKAVPDAVWNWYISEQKYDAFLAARTNNAKALLGAMSESVRLWPIYGLHQFGEDEDRGRDMLLTLTALALLVQRASGDTRPIVLALLNDATQLQMNLVEAFVAGNKKEIKEIITADYADSEYVKASPQKKQSAQQMVDVVDKLVDELDPVHHCTLLYNAITPEKIEEEVGKLGSNQFLLAAVGPVPQEVFNALYAAATLPPVFEGQGTSSLVISLGLPYLQTPKTGVDANNYPDLPLSYSQAGPCSAACAKQSQNLRDSLSSYININNSALYRTVLDELAGWTSGAYKDGEAFQVYFQSLGKYFQNDLNDKILLGCAGLNSAATSVPVDATTRGLGLLAPEADVEPLALKLIYPATDAEPLTLEQIYTALTDAWRDGSVDLLAALPGTALAAFYTPVVGASLPVAVAKDDIVEQKDGSGAVTAVLLRNGATKAFGVPFGMTLEFAATQGPVRSRMQCRSTDTWELGGVPWIALEAPGFDMDVPESPLPVIGGAVGTVRGTGLTLEIRYPVDDTWVISGSFAPPYPGIATFYAMAGGINLVQSMPAPLNTLAGFGLSRSQTIYDTTVSRIRSLLFEFRTSQPWTIVSTPKLQVQPRVTALIRDPGNLKTRTTSYRIAGDFTIGSGTISITAQYPDFQLVGALSDGVIDLSDLAKLFGVTVDLASAVTQFDLFVQPPTSAYDITTTLTADWPISVGGTTLFTITGLGFNVQGGRDKFTVSLSGTTIILPDTSDAVGLSLKAAYSDPGWVFSGEQTSGVVSLGALLERYMGWSVGQALGIDGLGLTLATRNSDWTFTGKTAERWEVPFISGLGVSASLRAGYRSPAQARTLPVAPAGAPAAGGYFARVETRWIWQNIDLTVWFDYNPDVNQYGITWGLLEGIVRGPDPATQDWTATLRFTQNTSLGSIIETMVSWATGSKFGLESPWDFLNAIPLSGLALEYTFNKTDSSRNKVSFSVAIGPINLGFARIDSIDVGYASTGKDRGVMVSLKGAFFWQSNPSEPLAWDASKPGTAPTPPGNGNKYLDLRLLAMGQHITLPCFATADTVQKAIDCMATLPAPTPGELPRVTFDPQSAWLIGTDFGVLKIDTGESGNRSGTALTTTRGGAPAAAPGYVLTLQAVFNDPHLYGLRVKLDGPAAKVFKGLDFQIMYRQVSDTVGVYQAEITLPDLMRHLTVGAYSLTLPVFGIAVYTNGDFQADIGFPWNENFSRSFTIEAIIPPGIPVIGSAGFYFGKLSSASTNRVPASSLGTFNPVLVFGFGMQVGFGKSIEYGILSAGFSVTVVGILEGVLAKWNPYRLTDAGREPSTQLQGDYYFWLRGTVGIVGKVYGTVDFAIVKADVNLTVKLLLQLTYESYVSITITVIASVDVSVSVRINLGLFKITISFSFSMRLKETFAIENTGTAPWFGDGRPVRGVLRAPVERRLSAFALARALSSTVYGAPDWRNLQPGGGVDLWGYLVPGLTAARDEWTQTGTPAGQLPCWVALLLIESVPPAGQDGDASARKAAGDAVDTSFEALAKMVLRWAIAAVHGPMTPAEVDRYPISATLLDWLATEVLVSTGDNPAPIPLDAVQAFLTTQFRVNLRVPPTDQDASADATYFPAPPQLRLTIPACGEGYPGVKYDLGTYNSLGQGTLGELRAWFDQLAVQVEREQQANGARPRTLEAEAPLSMAGWMFADYFLLLARQMVKAAQEALRDYKYPLTGSETPDAVVAWVNGTGQLGELYTLHDVFAANPQHALVAGKTLTVGVTVEIAAARTGNTFASLAELFDATFPASVLAEANAADPALLRAGATITFAPHAPYTVAAGDTLVSIAARYAVKLNVLLANSDVLVAGALLKDGATANFPFTTCTSLATDTFASVAARPVYAGGFTAAALATTNAGRGVLLEGAKVEYPGKTPYLVQPRDTLGDVANAFGVPVPDLLAKSAVLTQAGLLAPVASLAVPPFRYATQQNDTLAQVASRFAVDVSVLSDQPVNGGVAGLFAADAPLDLPHLPQFPVGELLAEAQRTGALQHLSGMASSYTMHGMRFPTSGRTDTGGAWSIVPNAMGMWVRDIDGKLTLPPQAGLYALTGQQFPLPALGTEPFSATFDRVDGVDTSWLRFVDAKGAPSDHVTLSVAPGSADATRITQVTQAARTRLDVPLDALGAGEMFHAALATYPFTSALQWLSAGPVSLPYGQAPASAQSLRLWRLPDALAALPDPVTHAVNPRFSLQVARYDDATGATETAKVSAYGWASTIDFTVRRIPPVAGSPASATTYEVVGAGGASIVLLERLLSQLQANDAAYYSLLVGYPPDGSSSAGEGVQTDAAANVTLGIAQVNLSTETRPPAGLAMAAMLEKALEQPELTLLNPPSEFVRLLWEASITRSSGFFLYYYDRASGRGLPEHAFNDRNEAALTLVVLYAKPASEAEQDCVASYMNAVATAETVGSVNAVLFAEAAPIPATVTAAAQTLAALAQAWFSDPADVAEANASAALRQGAPVRVSEGVYQAPPGGVSLKDLEQRFGTTVQKLNEANPLWGGLPDPLPFPAAIRVPDLTLTAGVSLHTASLADLAGWYGEPVAALAAHNLLVPGLFATGTALVIPGGPRVRTASVQPGVQALAALRPAPPQVDGASPAYGTDLLLNNFSLLNQQVVENVDFRPSNPPGLPAGPTTTPLADNGNDKVRIATPADQVETWNFGQALPYARFAKHVPQLDSSVLPPAKDSPYLGVGGILQVSFSWQDYYGNVLSTPLSDPRAGDPQPYNDRPLLTGYTDPLVALSQWPSVASSWQVAPPTDGGMPRLRIGLTFDPSRYQGLLQASASATTTIVAVFTDALDAASASELSHWQLVQGTVESASLGADEKTVTLTVSQLAQDVRHTVIATDVKAKGSDTRYSGQASFDWPDHPAQRSSTVQQNAAQDLHVYTQLYYQLTDPAGMALAVQSTLLIGDDGQAGSLPLPASGVDALMNWLFGTSGSASAYAFVLDRAQFGTAAAAPAAALPLDVDLKPEDLNAAQVFPLWTSFTLTRGRGTVLPGLETVAGIRSASTRVAPLQDAFGAAGDTLGLAAFATTFEQALSTPGAFRLKVATGMDRTLPALSGAGSSVWAVRLGLAAGQAISYAITDAGHPAVFAPQPASNRLISRTQVPIYDYTTGKGISATPSRHTDFTDVDLDTWCAQVFAAVDGLLTPQFTAPIQIVGELKSADYLQSILDGKKGLAQLAKLWMIPVFAGDSADPDAARAAFYQQLLVRLSAAYTTRAAVEFHASVTADVVEPGADGPPRLFGPAVRLGPAFEAATVAADAFDTVFLLFSNPMDPVSAGNVANYVLSDGIGVLSATVADATVTLVLATDVQPGQTTVTVSGVKDASGRAVRPPLVRTVTTGSAGLPASTLAFSSPKLTLQTGDARNLTYLVNAPDSVRGAGGELVSYVELDMAYQGSQIEHQIGALPGIEDYQASTWLSFVVPDADGPLTAGLGSFAVPMVLRAFPASPGMTAQDGAPTYDLDHASLSQLKQWDYAFTYSLPFHYPQDRVYGTVEFNLRQRPRALASFPDAFAQLAEFVTVFPEVNADLQTILAGIDATAEPVRDQQKIDEAAVALQSFIRLVGDLVQAAGGGDSTGGERDSAGPGLRFAPEPRLLTGDPTLTYAFFVEEGSARVGDTEGALVVSLSGAVPDGMGRPVVDVNPAIYEAQEWMPTGGTSGPVDRIYYVYKLKAGPGPDGAYLTAANGQTIPDRTVRLPALDILQRQDAWSTVRVERNRELVPGKPSADAFVYTTPEVRFANPLFPTNDADAEVDVSKVPTGKPVSRPLQAHLDALFADLLANNTQPQIVAQVEVTYEYALNAALERVVLPVLMQAPLTVNVAGTGAGTLAGMTSDWAGAIDAWFSAYLPACGGTLWMDLTLMSNLTGQAMPLLRLRRLMLPIRQVEPPLPCR